MRDSASTMRRTHIHIHTPWMRGAKDWPEKVFNNEKAMDAALGVMAIMLSGWLVYCLARAFDRCTYVI